MPSATEPPTSHRFAPLQPGTLHFDDAVRIASAAWPHEADGIADFFTRYATLPGYHGLVALRVDGATVGHGLGARSLPGDWWHDTVATQVGVEHPALQDAWALVNLAVVPEARGQGIGGALMESLLAAQPCPRALLSTEVSNTAARRLYERHGWRYLHPGFAFTPDDQPFVVMAREL